MLQAQSITELTLEQEVLIEETRKKWKRITFYQEPVDREKATKAIQSAYAILGKKPPEIVFCDSPVSAFNTIILGESMQQKLANFVEYLEQQLRKKLSVKVGQKINDQERKQLAESIPYLLEKEVPNYLKQLILIPPSPLKQLSNLLKKQIESQLDEKSFQQLAVQLNVVNDVTQSQLEKHLRSQLIGKLMNQLLYQIGYQVGGLLEQLLGKELGGEATKQLSNKLWSELDSQIDDELRWQFWEQYGSLFDFAISGLNCEVDQKHWRLFVYLVSICGGIYATEDICLICDRPRHLHFDGENRLHALGKPALEFADGYSIYSYQGVILPKKYGALPPEEWQTQWLLQETNSTLKDVLIQGIGYEKIQEELTANQLAIVFGKNHTKEMNEPDELSSPNLPLEPIKPEKLTGEPQEYFNLSKDDFFEEIALYTVEKFRSEATVLIPKILKKWRKTALNSEPINRQRAEAAVRNLYAVMGKNTPQVCFGDRDPLNLALTKLDIPNLLLQAFETSAWQELVKNNLEILAKKTNSSENNNFQEKFEIIRKTIDPLDDFLFQQLEKSLGKRLTKPIREQREKIQLEVLPLFGEEVSQLGRGTERVLSHQLQFNMTHELLWSTLDIEIFAQIRKNLKHQERLKLTSSLGYSIRGLSAHFVKLRQYLEPELWVWDGTVFELLFSHPDYLEYRHNFKRWRAFQLITSECGWILPFEKVCLVGNRPRKICLDSENRLHAEGEIAIEYDDSFRHYYYHGRQLPETYGKIHPNLWHPQWLLIENNAEWRRVLIQGIGYERVCQELNATELDSWREYKLLRINANVDIEPIHLLKMICPSTGFVHVLRVPPDIPSARQAICWANWDVDPGQFSVET